MAENLVLISGTKINQYINIIPQIESLLHGENDFIANLANISSVLKQQFNWLWVGFYIVKKNELVLGPFQGPIACTRIKKGRGVCGKCWQKKETLIVPDVEKFSDHISCSTLSKSEIVVPIFKKKKLVAVLDADSILLNDFDEIDKKYLEKVCSFLDIK